MALKGVTEDITYTAAADLRTHKNKIVRIAADGEINLSGAASATMIGVLQNDPNTGEAAAVAIRGEPKVIVGGAVGSAGLYLKSDANGLAVVAASGDNAIGISQETAAGSGTLIRMLIDKQTIGAQA